MVGGLYNAILFRTFHPIGRDSLVVVMSGTSDCGLCCLLLMQFILRPLIGPGKKVRKPGSSLRLGLLTTILISLHILHLPSPLRRERPRPPRVSSHSVSALALREHKLVIFVKGWPSSLLRSTNTFSIDCSKTGVGCPAHCALPLDELFGGRHLEDKERNIFPDLTCFITAVLLGEICLFGPV